MPQCHRIVSSSCRGLKITEFIFSIAMLPLLSRLVVMREVRDKQ